MKIFIFSLIFLYSFVTIGIDEICVILGKINLIKELMQHQKLDLFPKFPFKQEIHRFNQNIFNPSLKLRTVVNGLGILDCVGNIPYNGLES